MSTPITPLVPADLPSLTRPAELNQAFQDFVQETLPTMVDEINVALASGNLLDTNSTSTSSISIDTNSPKVFAVGADKGYQVGMFVLCANTGSPTNFIYGQVTSYTGGNLTVTNNYREGSGTVANWTISQSSALSFDKHQANIFDLTANVSSNAMTITTPADTITFRSATLSTGNTVDRTFTSNLTLTIPQGATLGSIAGTTRLLVLAIDNAGTVELAVTNSLNGLNLDESGLISTTILNTASDFATVIYSATARSNVAYRVIGYVESAQATAGTYATAPSRVQGAGGLVKPYGSGRVVVTPDVVASGQTSLVFSGIGNTCKRITLVLKSLSTSGTSDLVIRLRLSTGAVLTTNYTGMSTNSAASTANAVNGGFGIHTSMVAAGLFSGQVIISSGGSSTLAQSGLIGRDDASSLGMFGISAGTRDITGSVFDGFVLTTVNGTDTFDAGSCYAILEF